MPDWVSLDAWGAARAATPAAEPEVCAMPSVDELAEVSEESLQRICAHFVGFRRTPHKGFHR